MDVTSKLSGVSFNKSLLSRICDEFPKYPDYQVQLSALGVGNEYYDFYEGPLSNLSIDDLDKVVKDQSRFHHLRIVGIDVNYVDNIASNRDLLIRRDICWLSDPAPPTVVEKSRRSLKLEWPLVTFSTQLPRSTDHIKYELEMCIAPENINTGICFITVLSQPNTSFITVEDLSPATTYLLRLIVTYSGTSRKSDVIAVTTDSAPPSAPSKPRLYNHSIMENNFSAPKSCLLLRWSDAEANGFPVQRYSVQIKKIFSDGSISPGDKISKRASSPDTHRKANPPFLVVKMKTNHKTQGETKNSNSNDESGQAEYSEWKTIYSNSTNKCFVSPPEQGIAEWHIRVKSQNALGWSDFSEPLIVNARSHPSLFNAILQPPISQAVLDNINSVLQTFQGDELIQQHSSISMDSSNASEFAQIIEGFRFGEEKEEVKLPSIKKIPA